MRITIPSAILSLAVWWLTAACSVVERSPSFTDVVSGRIITPLVAPGGGVAVLVFATTDCPIANGYAPLLRRLESKWRDRPVRFTIVHVDGELTEAEARQHAAEYGLASPVVIDREHALVRRTGVTITPEAVVYAADGALRYRGRIDNWYGDIGRKRPKATRHDLDEAVDAVLGGRPVTVARTAAIGCTIEPLPSKN